MPCYYPRNVVRSKRVCHPKTGKPVVFFKKSAEKNFRFWTSSKAHFKFYRPEVFQIPGCKPKCVGCQEDYSRAWAVRCWHESMKHDANCFITLTFNDSYVPKGGLDHRWFQLFMKRFRRFLAGSVGASSRSIKFFMAGEYGSLNFRPHFHACIFGYDFPDRVLWTKRDDVNLYTSDLLSKLWSDPRSGDSYGFSSVGDVSFASAAYIARYCAKKAGGAAVAAGLPSEYVRMSLKPGIGKTWIESYKDSVYPDDAVSLGEGVHCKVPRYYDKYIELTDPTYFATLKSNRKASALASPDNTPERLKVREKIKKAQLKQLTRSL